VETVTVPVDGLPRVSSRLVIQDQLQVSTARLQAMAMARAHGFPSDAIERTGLVADEMAANILHHAGIGDIILRTVGEPTSGCVEILALDKGPGIGDIRRALRKVSAPAETGGSANGLPGVRKLADLFDVYAPPGRGTVVVAHVGATVRHRATCACGESLTRGTMGVVCLPLHGEEECGDSWAVETVGGTQVVFLVDGLGHGPQAASAALAAMTVFREMVSEAPEVMLRAMHLALHHTRGAALSLAVLDRAARTAHFYGVGNVEGRVVTLSANRHLLPQNGIVGQNMPRIQCATAEWPADGRLVMHSDGVSTRWRADQYPGLLARHPSLLAGVIFRDCARARDDATVLVLRDCSPAPVE
jgi:anti-sigma regulatory factor (Ser/Thr protein kinase)